jgi:uncharacterized protein (DUF2336 family)
MTAPTNLIAELETAIANSSAPRRADILLHVTDLFVGAPNRFSADEISFFDDIIVRLATTIEVGVRSLLAHRLAPIPNAPSNITRLLANDDEIRVAYPILAQSERLDDEALVQAARTKSQKHLLAISRRKSLGQIVTDVLVERGDQQVVLSTAKNSGAKFSNSGFARLVSRSSGDDVLTSCVGLRPDLPQNLYLTLLATASEIVRSKLTLERPHLRPEIEQAVARVAGNLHKEATSGPAQNAAGHASMQMNDVADQAIEGRTDAVTQSGRLEEMVPALARACKLPLEFVENALREDQPETILILAKAAKLSWTTAKALLSQRAGAQQGSTIRIDQCMAGFERLNLATAQQIVQFWSRRAQASRKQHAPHVPQSKQQSAR